MDICHGCGRSISRDIKFCKSCGTESSTSSSPSQNSRFEGSGSSETIPPDFKSLVKLIYENTKKNFFRRLPLSITIGVSVWLVHTFLLVYINEGWKVQNFLGNLLALKGQVFSGVIVSTIIGIFLSSILMRKKGQKKGPGIKARIDAIKVYFGEARMDAFSVLIAGIGMVLVLGAIVTKAASLVLAVGFGAMLASRMGSVLALLLRSFWNAAFGVLRSEKIKHYGMAAGFTGIAGALVGSAINFVFDPGLLIGLIALVIAVAIVFGSSKSSTTASVILAVISVTAFYFYDIPMAFADDGGWKEAGSNIGGWLKSPGAITAVIIGVPPAIGAAVGASLGPVLNDIANSLPEVGEFKREPIDTSQKRPNYGSSGEVNDRNDNAPPNVSFKENLGFKKPKPDYGSSYKETNKNDNAPPNVSFKEKMRYRAPTPILDPQGKPYPVDNDGRYWGPDANGGWSWMDRSDALKAAAEEQRQAAEWKAEEERIAREKADEQAEKDQQARQAQREEEEEKRRLEEYERQRRERFDRGTEDDMRRSREAIRAKNEQERENEIRARQEAELESQRQEQLDQGITNAMSGFKDDERSRVTQRLIKAQEEGDTEAMRSIWQEVRGHRQTQIDAAAEKSRSAKVKAELYGVGEYAAGTVVTSSKVILSAGLGSVTGGTLTAVEAVIVAGLGTTGLAGIGAVEEGIKEKDGEIIYDGKKAVKGAIKGMADASNAMVGGIAANGSKLVSGAKATYAGGSTYSRVYNDILEKTNNKELADAQAKLAAIAAMAGSLAGDGFDALDNASKMRAAGIDMDRPISGKGAWWDSTQRAATAEQMRIGAAKKVANMTTNTLGNIASADKDTDATTIAAFGKAAKGEVSGYVAGKIVGSTIKGQDTELTSSQQRVIDRLNAARPGNKTTSKAMPEYNQSMATPKTDSEVDTNNLTAKIPAENKTGRLNTKTPTSNTEKIKSNLTQAQQEVVNRLNTERTGVAPKQKITPDYEEYLNQRSRSPSSTIPEGNRGEFVDVPSIEGDTGGFTKAGLRHLQTEADSQGVKITVRRVDPGVAADLEAGRIIPKPPDLKANTGKEADIAIGMDPEHINRVVVFEPKLPAKGDMSDADWGSIQNRHKLRQDQFEAYHQKIMEGENYDMDGQLVRDRETGLPVGGDNDVFAIRGLHGEPVPKAVTDNTMRRLIRNPEVTGQNIPSDIEHREHLGWNIRALDNTEKGSDGKTDYERAGEINQRIIAKIRPGQESLATITGRSGMGDPVVDSSHYTGAGPSTERTDDD